VIGLHRIIMTAEIAANHGTRLARHPEDYLPCIRTLIEEGLRRPATDYIEARRGQVQVATDMERLFENADVLACPSTVGGAPDTSTTGDPLLNAPWSFTGLPTITLPIGLDEDGLPLGLQLVARRFDEEGLFRAAARCEELLQPLVAGNV
jgi:aspartyl-tRNA(Asn)/glutamyl-tRNA(Gln) amidotransferase subunit A